MAGIKHLKDVRIKKGDDFLDNLINNFVIINESIDGTFFGVKKDKETDSFKYFKSSGEITYVDRMLMKFYNPAIAYFQNLSEEKRNRIPSNFYFGFEYVSRRDSKSMKLSRSPKNNLVLSYIHRLDENGKPVETLQTKDDLDRWAYYLEVEAPPIIFEGKLDDEQKNSVLEFAYSSSEELIDKFKTTSFTKYIISILNSKRDESSISGEIESIVFRFYDENDENAKEHSFLAKIVDPLFQEKVENNKPAVDRKSNDYIWLIIIDLMNHIEMYSEDSLRKLCEAENDYDSKYIKLMNSIYKDFISKYSNKYAGLELDTPEYLKRPEFEVDYNMISDEKVNTYIKSNETFKEIYRILINFFRKVRKRSSSSFFGKDLLDQLNITVKKIKRIVMGDSLYEGLFPSFGEYIGEDGSDEVYVGEQETFKNRKKGNKTEKVNIIVGKFQPVHNGHIKAAEKLKDKNGLPTVFVCIMKSNREYPISERSARILLEKVQQSHSELIRDIKVVNRDSIKDVLKEINPEYSPVLWGSADRQIKDYVLQLEYINKKNIPIRISKEFKLVEIPKFQSSSKVLTSISAGDYSSFKEMVPKSISSEFFNLQKEIEFYESK